MVSQSVGHTIFDRSRPAIIEIGYV